MRGEIIAVSSCAVSLPPSVKGRLMSRRLLWGAAVLFLVAVSCSGTLSTGEYYAEIEGSVGTYDADTAEIFSVYRSAVQVGLEEFEQATAGDDLDSDMLAAATVDFRRVTVAEITQAFREVKSALDRYVLALDRLAPPSELETVHAEWVATLQRAEDAIPELITELRSAATLQAISGIINGSAFGDVQPRVVAACRKVEEAALVLDRLLDLKCGSATGP